ncbi:MAG: ECF-type sigma factor [Gemmataceae bacterium]
MGPDDSFPDLIHRLRQGDQDAARRIFDAFVRRLMGLARGRLDRQILRKEDPEDIAASALASFFRRDKARPFDLASWDDLWSLLAVITMRKCGHRVEYYLAACRNVRREAAPGCAADDSTLELRAIAREPTADEVATFEDTVRQLLTKMDDRDREVVRLVLEGFSVPEIHTRTQRSEYTIRKVIDKVRARWERLDA